MSATVRLKPGIAELRGERPLSQTADAAGVSIKTLVRAETGRVLRPASARRIAAFYGVALEELITS